jgi:serine kinase of HPr protein (carbohydrate metabolism regulator)
LHPHANSHHACALEIHQKGILIKGVSGSGKTSLCLGLLEQAERRQIGCFFITDDQALISFKSGKIFASAPESIQGLVEIRGYGIIPYSNKTRTEISLVVELVDDATVERMPDTTTIELENTIVPYLKVPIRHENQAVRIVFAWLYDNTDLKLV